MQHLARYCAMLPDPPSPARWRTVSIVAACVLLAIAVLAVATIAVMHTATFQRAAVNYAARHLGRHIEVNGALELDLLSRKPSLTATRVTLSNPAWMRPGVTAQIGRLKIVFDFPWPGRDKSIRTLEMTSAKLNLVRDAEGRANWQWTPPGAPKGRGVLVRSLHVPDAHVVLNDSRRQLQFEGIVTAGDVPAGAAPAPLRIEGKGQLNGRPADFAIDGDPLAVARHDRPYAFTFSERSGNAQLRGRGQLLRPFDPGMLDAEFAANGASTEELYFLAGLHFPKTAPFTLTGQIERRGPVSNFKNLEAHFGRSDVRGTVAMTIVEGRRRFEADLASRLLRLPDFGAHDKNGAPLPSSASDTLLLPDVKVPLNGLRNRDAVIRYRADAVESRALSVSAFSTQATIDRGVLTASHLQGRFRDGRISGQMKVDVTKDVPHTTLDLTLADLPLARIAGKDQSTPPFDGLLQSRLQISGRGNSVHELAASSSGTLSFSMAQGAMRASMAEMSAATLRGLGLKLTNSTRETPVRCGAATFRARDGVFSAERLIVETDPVVITGVGDIRLDSEALNLTLHGEPRTPRLLRLRSPVNLVGTLKHPSFRLGSGGGPAPQAAKEACEPQMIARLPEDDAPAVR